MKKKILIILLTTLLGVNLISCVNENSNNNTSSNNKKVEETTKSKENIKVIDTKDIDKNSNESTKEQYLKNLNEFVPIQKQVDYIKNKNVCRIYMHDFMNYNNYDEKTKKRIPKFKKLKVNYNVEGKDYPVTLVYKNEPTLYVENKDKITEIQVSDKFNPQTDVKITILDYKE